MMALGLVVIDARWKVKVCMIKAALGAHARFRGEFRM